jgi:outer membrane protein OmpA-like peptidoglycan-associated protein
LDKDDACPTVPGLPEYNGCPKPKTVTATATTEALKNIYFNFNKATLRPEAEGKLDVASKILKTDGGNYLITGATDKKGNDTYNLRLSKERAAAVVAGLEARGVNPSTLKSVGVGEQLATVPETASDAERMADRKVIVTAIEDDAKWNAIPKHDIEAKKAAPAKKAPAKKVAKKKK